MCVCVLVCVCVCVCISNVTKSDALATFDLGLTLRAQAVLTEEPDTLLRRQLARLEKYRKDVARMQCVCCRCVEQFVSNRKSL